MGWIGFYMHSKRSSSAAHALRPYAGFIDFIKQFLFQCSYILIRMGLSCLSEQRFFRQVRSFFHGAAYAYAYDYGRAGVGSCPDNSVQHKLFNSVRPVCRFQHGQPAHVFAAKALGGCCDFYPVPFRHFQVNHSRGIIPGIFPCKGIQHGFPEISFFIAPAHAFIYRILQASSCYVHLPAQLYEYNRHAGILAERKLFFPGNMHIIQKLLQNPFPQGRLFFVPCLLKQDLHIIPYFVTGLYAELFNCLCNKRSADRSHVFT